MTPPAVLELIEDSRRDAPRRAAEGFLDLECRIPVMKWCSLGHVSPKSDHGVPYSHRQRRSLAGFGRKLAQSADFGVHRQAIQVALCGLPRGIRSRIPHQIDEERFRQETFQRRGCQDGRSSFGSPLSAALLPTPSVVISCFLLRSDLEQAHSSTFGMAAWSSLWTSGRPHVVCAVSGLVPRRWRISLRDPWCVRRTQCL